jgi:hypothetical protein
MNEFQQVVETESSHLQTLWKEWHNVKMGLVCVAIEVLGPEGVGFSLGQDDQGIPSRTDTAVDAHQRDQANRAAVREKAGRLKQAIYMTAGKSMDDLYEQEKVRQRHESSICLYG